MKTIRSLIVAFIALCCTRCSSSQKSSMGLDALPEQVFTINTANDTTILTKDSILFSFEKGSFNTTAQQVTITIKEALHLSDMLRAGLTTTADGEMLQSSGMFNIAAEVAGQNVQLQKMAGVKLPTYKYRDDMVLYKGQLKNGQLSWTEPAALLTKEEVTVAESGKEIYKSNCANCHQIDKD